jgi:hypothetical protein
MGMKVDSHGDDELLGTFRQAFEDDVSFPCGGVVIGENKDERPY